jgi:hypothetical protein
MKMALLAQRPLGNSTDSGKVNGGMRLGGVTCQHVQAEGEMSVSVTFAIELSSADESRSIEGLSEHESPFLLPAGAFDTHVHVFDPSLGSYCSSRAYTPASAASSELLSFTESIAANHRPANLVVVQPSPYGTDNTVLIEILQQLRNREFFVRGIAVVDVFKVSDSELWMMHNAGIRGLRLNLQAGGHKVNLVTLEKLLKRAAERIRDLPGWKLQMFAPGHVWDGERISFRKVFEL